MNALLALAVMAHESYVRAANWVERLGASGVSELATCSITELGFVRVLGQAQQYGSSVAQARELLLKMRNSDGMRWIFTADNDDISRLPRWVRLPKQTTDGHLAELAWDHEAVLATLDRRTPRAFIIPYSRHS